MFLASSQKNKTDQKRGQYDEFNKLIRVNSSTVSQSHLFNLEFQKSCEMLSGYTHPHRLSSNQKCYFNKDKKNFKYDSNLEMTFFLMVRRTQVLLMKGKEGQ